MHFRFGLIFFSMQNESDLSVVSVQVLTRVFMFETEFCVYGSQKHF